MARDQYFVVLCESGWKIRHNGEHSAHYRSKTEAIQDAVAAACRAGKRGQDAQVIVQGEDLGSPACVYRKPKPGRLGPRRQSGMRPAQLSTPNAAGRRSAFRG
jgi:hypothetical protein